MKKLAALLLTTAVLLALPLSAGATGDQTTQVSLDVYPIYMVTIPSTIELGSYDPDNDTPITKTLSIALTKSALLTDIDLFIFANSDNNYCLKNGNDSIQYVLEDYNGQTYYNGSTQPAAIVSVNSPEAELTLTLDTAGWEPTVIGSYSDIIEFTVKAN